MFEFPLRQILLLPVCAAVISCSSDRPGNSVGENSEAGTSSSAPERAGPAEIDPNVFSPYTRQGYPKTFEKWKPAGIARVQKLREAAARTVADNPKCDFVDLADLSEARSTAPDNPVVFVDCRYGERLYLSESDNGANVATEKDKGASFSGAELIQRCTEEVRRKLSLPSSFDRDWFSVSDRQGTSGNRVIEFTFEAKNRLGLTLPAAARCVMTTQGTFEVDVVER